jgi:2-polyprenyl-6-methoxyphenol hydroxylase-like FAD-dependent oxidoreductase
VKPAFRLLIVGGGIAGLTLAAALRRRGMAAELVERAPAWAPVGSGIGLGINAVLGLRAVGAEAMVAARGVPCRRWDIVDEAARMIVRFDFAGLAHKLGASAYSIHRADLHEALLAAADGTVMTLGTTLAALVQDDRGVDVTFSDGRQRRYDLVVGADGIRSQVRRLAFGEGDIAYAGYTAFRTVVERPPGMSDIMEMWGPGRRVGLSPINDRQLYCYTTLSTPRGGADAPEARLALFREAFTSFGGRFPDVLAQLREPGQLSRGDIEEVIDHPWRRGRVVLIGDAAHAMTPNLGQGGAMAIEDAVALARTLDRIPATDAALDDFLRRRHARVLSVQNRSRSFGRLGHVASPLGCSLRNFLIRRVGSRRMWGLVAPQMKRPAPQGGI